MSSKCRSLNQGFQRNPCNRGTVADMCGIRMKETYCFFEGSLHSNRPMAAAALFIGRDVDARVGMQVKLAPGKTSDSLSLFFNASRSSSRLQDEINLILARARPCLRGRWRHLCAPLRRPRRDCGAGHGGRGDPSAAHGRPGCCVLLRGRRGTPGRGGSIHQAPAPRHARLWRGGQRQ